MNKNSNISKFDNLFKEGLENHAVTAPPANFIAGGTAAGVAKVGLSKIALGLGTAAIIGAGSIYLLNKEEGVPSSTQNLTVQESIVSQETIIEEETEPTVFESAQKELESNGKKNTTAKILSPKSNDLLGQGQENKATENLSSRVEEESFSENKKSENDERKGHETKSIEKGATPLTSEKAFIIDGKSCFGEKITISLTNSTSIYSWFVNERLFASGSKAVRLILESRIPYNIEVRDNGLKIADTFIDLSRPKGIVQLNKISEDLTYLEVISSSLKQGAWHYEGSQISNDKMLAYSGNNFHYPPYYVVKNDVGCTDTFFAENHSEEAYLNFVSEIFTPNGDGLNDVYDIDAKGCKNFSVNITDVNGKVVYQSFDPTFEWDGLFNGSSVSCPEGWYSVNVTYNIEGKENTEKRFSKVLLKR